MSNHSVIEHRANYHFLKVEEDFLAICSTGEESPHCKALILAILEHWTNIKRDQGQKGYIYMTIPEWIAQTYEWYARNVIINCLRELLHDQLIERRSIIRYEQNTYEYKLNIDAIQKRIRALPEKARENTTPNLSGYHAFLQKKKAQREKEKGRLKINEGVREKSTALKSKRRVGEKSTKGRLKINEGYVKNQRNIDTNIDTFLASSEITSRESAASQDCDVDANASHTRNLFSLSEETTVQYTPTPPPSGKEEMSPEQKQRVKSLHALIRGQRGYKLTKRGAIINENVCVISLIKKHSDTDLFDTLHYLAHCDFKWSKPDNKYKIGAQVISDEIDRVLHQFSDDPQLRTATETPSQRTQQAPRRTGLIRDDEQDHSFVSDYERRFMENNKDLIASILAADAASSKEVAHVAAY